MADEKIILDVIIDTNKAEQNVTALTGEIITLTKSQQDLKKAVNEGKISEVEYQKELEKNKNQLKQTRSEQQANIKVLTTAKGSLEGLRAANAALRKERDKVDVSTKQGRKLIAEFNKEIDKNDKAIQKNSDAMAKQRLNIGNYSSALGPLGAGLQKINGLFKLLIANPIVLLFTALAAAVTAVIKLFKDTDEGGTKMKATMEAINVVWAKFKDAIIDSVENIGKRFEILGKRFEELWAWLKRDKEELEKLKDEIADLKQKIDDNKPWEGFIEGATEAAKRIYNIELALDSLNDVMIGSISSQSELQNKLREYLNLSSDQTLLDQERLKYLKLADQAAKEYYGNIAKWENENFELEADRLSARFDLRKEDVINFIKLNGEEQKKARETSEVYANVWNKAGDEKIKALEEAYAKSIEAETSYNRESRRITSQLTGFEKKQITDRENAEKKKNENLLKDQEQFDKDIEELTAETFDSEIEAIEKQNELLGEKIDEKNIEEIQKDLKLKQELTDNFQKYLNDSLELMGASYDERFLIAQRFTNSILELQQKRLKGEKITYDDGAAIAKGVAGDILADKKNKLSAELEAYTNNMNDQIDQYEEGSKERQILEKQLAEKTYQIQLKQFKLEKANALLQVAINTAVAVAKVWGQTGIGGIIAQIAPIAMGVVQAALILSKKPPEAPQFSKGTILDGPSHKFGGIKIFNKKTGQFYGEAEGGEPILTKGVSQNPFLLKQASRINVAGGGAPLVPSTYMQNGGVTTENAGIDLNQLGIILADQLRKNPPVVGVKDIITGLNERAVTVENGIF